MALISFLIEIEDIVLFRKTKKVIHILLTGDLSLLFLLVLGLKIQHLAKHASCACNPKRKHWIIYALTDFDTYYSSEGEGKLHKEGLWKPRFRGPQGCF